MIAKVAEFNKAEVKEKIEGICTVNSQVDNLEIVSLLKKLVPEYRSNNSIYEKLDKD